MEEFRSKIDKLVYTLPYHKIISISDNNLREILLKRYAEERDKLLKIYFCFQDYFDETKSL